MSPWLHGWTNLVRRHANQRTETARLLSITAALPHDTRRAVTLRKVYELPVPEIAARLDIPKRVVEQHLITAALAYARAHANGGACAKARPADSTRPADPEGQRAAL